MSDLDNPVPVVDSSGSVIDPLINFTYTNGSVGYTDGTTEAYIFKNGTAVVGTITLVYLDNAKGSLSTFTRS